MTTTTTTGRMSPTKRLPASGSLAVLVLLVAGRTARQVADATTWNRRRVVELAQLRGWRHDPDTDRVHLPPSIRRRMRPDLAADYADLEAELRSMADMVLTAV